ncbi:MAG: alcohol dehydrogenase catalytic domain-containing protein, partial [Gemmatimonadota bacterium]
MKAVTFQGVESLAFEEVPEPRLVDDHDALVEVTVAGICGSDLHPYFGRETGLDRGTVMGHEFVGRVVEVGPAVAGVAPGDRVVAPFTTSCGSCFY